MKTRAKTTLMGQILLCLLSGFVSAAPLGTAFTYQGKLTDGGAPANGTYDLRFTIYDGASGGSPTAGPVTNSAVAVANGLFTVTLDFGASAFSAKALWLEMAARTNATGAFAVFPVRQALSAAPYALYAANAGAAAAGAVSASSLSTSAAPSPGQVLTYNGTQLAWLSLSSTGAAWSLAGNTGTAPGASFLGTTDNQPLELKVNGQRALRLEPTTNSTPNVLGGFAGNQVSSGVYGATIAGGGASSAPQVVAAPGGTVGGGAENHVLGMVGTVAGGQANLAGGTATTVGGGAGNTIATNSAFATIPGGQLNVIEAGSYAGSIGGGTQNRVTNVAATVGGGNQNLAGGLSATVAGGEFNQATGRSSAIAGGSGNHANGQYGFVGGGDHNRADGDVSFAAGRRARANHGGAFVWADSIDADFVSTGANQFLIRASGGVGIGVTSPSVALDVAGTVKATSLAVGSSMVVTNLGTTDNQPLEFQVNGLRALRLEPTGDSGSDPDLPALPDGAPNLIGGAPNNWVMPGVVGATISGGGATNWNGSPYPNTISADFSSISGGKGNSIETGAHRSAIGGGSANTIQTNASGSTIGGGDGNIAGKPLAAVGGGLWNIAGGTYSTVAGGELNVATNDHAAVVGGYRNVAGNDGALVGGGFRNSASGSDATVVGGSRNTAGGMNAFVGGGESNATTNQYGVVVGGQGNAAFGDRSFVGGGLSNWTYNVYATIGGGLLNFAGYPYTVIGGGSENAAVNQYSTIGGGYGNSTKGGYATVPGGDHNQADGDWSFAAGHRAKTSSPGCFVWGDGTAADIWAGGGNQFVARATGGFWFITAVDANGVPTCQAYLGHCSPSWSITSDRNQKENFKAVDQRALLEKLARLPVTEWTMKGEKPGLRHIGPVAQDFHAAFGLGGDDDRRIVSSDETGVAFAAIQGLNQKLEETVREKDAEIQALKQRLERLEQLLTHNSGGGK